MSCGRRIEWRAKWADDWEQVRYCSDACRSRGVRPLDEALERALLALLDARGPTVDLTEVAALVAGSQHAPDATPQELREPARRAARRLVARGEVELLQRGRVVDPSTARGPLDVRRIR